MLSAAAGAELNKGQVFAALEARYFKMLPTRFPTRPLVEQRRDRFSRALAAFAIQKLSDCSDTTAAASVVDCGDDHGIDAIYYDRRQNMLWLVQSKFGDAPDQGANLAFCSGITDLILERYDRFYQSGNNPEFDRVQADVEDALKVPITGVVACVVYLGNPLGPHAIGDLNELKVAQNAVKNWFDWRDIGLPVLHGWLTSEQAVGAIHVDLTLEKWYFFTDPRRAVYGLVSATQLNALYSQYGNALFQRNIRHYLGSQAVNVAISETVHAQPDELFYLNNGLTVICSHFDYAGNNNEVATFTLSNFSIVNGAQTVGSIGFAGQNGPISNNAKLLVTILEIGDGDASIQLGHRITRARNTQTSVNRDDFVALDPNQERLRQELAISDVIYHYRPSAESVSDAENQFSLGDATRTLACFSGDTEIIVVAKKEISLINDRNGSYYSRLFRDNLTGTQLFRRVQIYRYADGILDNAEETEPGRRQMFFRHGRYFIMHIWARRSQAMLNKAELILSDNDKLEVSAQILELAEQILSVAEPMFAADNKGYLKIFRNLTDAQPLAQAVMEHLNQPTEANG